MYASTAICMTDTTLESCNDDSPIESMAERVRLCVIRIAAEQNKSALAELMELMANRILHFAIKHVGDESLAREIVQDTLMAVWTKAASFDQDKAKATTWIFTIARNLCYDQGRRKLSRPQLVSAEDVYQDVYYQDSSSSQTSDSELDKDKILLLIEELSVEQRQVVNLVCIQDYSHADTANILQLPLGTVKSRLRLALAKLALMIKDKGYGYD